MTDWKPLINTVLSELKVRGGKFRGYKSVDNKCIRVFIGWSNHLSSIFVTPGMQENDIIELLDLSKLRKSNVLAPNEI